MLKPVFIILFLLASCACTRVIELNPKFEKQPIYDPLPLTIAVYKSPEFVNRIEKRDLFIYPVGKASSKLFDQVLAKMFTTVVPTNTKDPKLLSGHPQPAGIIEIDIMEFFSSVKYMKNSGLIYTGPSYPYTITYSFSITDASGAPVAKWSVLGHSSVMKPCPDSILCTHGEVSEYVMLDAMTKFILDFHTKPEIIHWLSQHGIKEGEEK